MNPMEQLFALAYPEEHEKIQELKKEYLNSADYMAWAAIVVMINRYMGYMSDDDLAEIKGIENINQLIDAIGSNMMEKELSDYYKGLKSFDNKQLHERLDIEKILKDGHEANLKIMEELERDTMKDVDLYELWINYALKHDKTQWSLKVVVNQVHELFSALVCKDAENNPEKHK